MDAKLDFQRNEFTHFDGKLNEDGQFLFSFLREQMEAIQVAGGEDLSSVPGVISHVWNAYWKHDRDDGISTFIRNNPRSAQVAYSLQSGLESVNREDYLDLTPEQEAIHSLREELAGLTARVEALEAGNDDADPIASVAPADSGQAEKEPARVRGKR